MLAAKRARSHASSTGDNLQNSDELLAANRARSHASSTAENPHNSELLAAKRARSHASTGENVYGKTSGAIAQDSNDPAIEQATYSISNNAGKKAPIADFGKRPHISFNRGRGSNNALSAFSGSKESSGNATEVKASRAYSEEEMEKFTNAKSPAELSKHTANGKREVNGGVKRCDANHLLYCSYIGSLSC